MKNARPLLVIMVSILIGAAAVGLAAKWVKDQPSLATTQVVVAARDLDVGTRLRPEYVKVVEWPAGTQLKEPFSDPAKVADRVVNAQLLAGEPVLNGKLAPPGEKAGLSAQLAEGRRAITVKVNEVVGVAGFALPGNYVDVMVNTYDDSNRPISKIVLERIMVLAVAQDVGTRDNQPRVVSAVTLEVTPQQAEQLDLARSVGTLSLVLRSQVDKAAASTTGARKNDLLKFNPVIAADVPAPAAAAASGDKPAPLRRVVVAQRKPIPSAAPRMEQVEVIRGTKKSVEAFEPQPE